MKEFGMGGAERWLLELAPRMPEVDFLPVAVVDKRRDLIPYLESAGMAPVNLQARGPFDLRWLPRLRRLVKHLRPDLVHVQNPYPGAGSRIALLGLKVPLVYTEHNLWESYHPATRLANTATFWLNDASIVVSDEVRQSIASSILGRFYVRGLVPIPGGIDPDLVREEASAGSEIAVAPGSYGTVTRLTKNKAVEVLIAAAALLQRRGYNAACYVVGGGALRERLESRRQDLGGDQVQFLGPRDDARAILANLSVFVIPSKYEGLPMVLLEALALGVPVVATQVGGIPEVITHRKSGLLVPKDDPAALADAIQELLEDQDLASRLTREGRKLVESNFHIGTTANRILSVYRQLLGR